MKIVIPMAGEGKRFVGDGYTMPKPLIRIHGRPMIEHVVRMFHGGDDFVFICNNQHLEKTDMRDILKRIKPAGNIIGIDYKCLGPAWGILEALKKDDFLEDDSPVIVNYCDFIQGWNFEDFKRFVSDTNADGCITAYKGFHPHLLGPDYYGHMRWKVIDGRNVMLEIKEKESFTDNKMNEFGACGCYYYKKGMYIKKFFNELLEKNITVNGEFHGSLAHNLMNDNGLVTYIYEVKHFLQWGTPRDLKEYEHWSNYFITNTFPVVEDAPYTKIYEYWKSFFKDHNHMLSGKKIKGMMIDLDGTLYDYEKCNEYAKQSLFIRMCEDLGMEYDQIKEVYHEARNIIKKGIPGTASSHSRLLYIQKTLELLGVKNYISKSLVYDRLYWESFFREMKLFEGAADLLRYAYENGIKVCVVTDLIASVQMSKIVHLGIEDYIDFIVSSEEAGLDKPAVPIFTLALKKLGLKPEEVIMLGDDKERDSGYAAGIASKIINPHILRSGKIVDIIESI